LHNSGGGSFDFLIEVDVVVGERAWEAATIDAAD
jgi:hypothetical protein